MHRFIIIIKILQYKACTTAHRAAIAQVTNTYKPDFATRARQEAHTETICYKIQTGLHT
jgi:hypothetical protein